MYIRDGFQEQSLSHKNHGHGNYQYYEQSHLASKNGSEIYYFHFRTLTDQRLHVDYQHAVFKLVLCFGGYSETYYNEKKLYSFEGGKALFYKTTHDHYTSFLKAGTNFKIFHFHLSEHQLEELQRVVPDLLQREVVEVPLPPQSFELIKKDYLSASCRRGLQDLFIEKVIFDQLYNFLYTVKGHEELLHNKSKSDRDKAMEAKHILDTSPQYVSIEALSKAVGINTFKLKNIFKENTDSTIFEYQANLHLSKAYQLLLDTDLSVDEIAHTCGYLSVGSFSNAFKRKYGIRPSGIKKFGLNKPCS